MVSVKFTSFIGFHISLKEWLVTARSFLFLKYMITLAHTVHNYIYMTNIFDICIYLVREDLVTTRSSLFINTWLR